MFFKQNPMDHLTDDPIIRCDIADRISKAAESDGNLPIAWRRKLQKEPVKPARLLAQCMLRKSTPSGLNRGCAAVLR
ncbi:hypothetical protein MES5069_550168 [Mesorhizobium escarrei]|uniref:Uncharacterized protein n=1 Tax=Mesorhizobium escarrei TaxID=666018 RepID=A0ABM9ECY0_9HYPH|nr:hypothetical protein MES5069_550168 [Mesorhizobium escarrei]